MDIKKDLQTSLESADLTALCSINPITIVDTEMILSNLKSVITNIDALLVLLNPFRVGISNLIVSEYLINNDITPILSLTTRDRNRIEIISTVLTSRSIGLRDILCTSGYHLSLGDLSTVRGVYDIDVMNLVRIINDMNNGGDIVKEMGLEEKVDIYPGITTNCCAEPVELHILHLLKKISSGAKFVITQPVFSVDYFKKWMKVIEDEGMLEKVKVIVSVMPLKNYDFATERMGMFISDKIPDEILQRLKSADDEEGESLIIANELITEIKGVEGISGVNIFSPRWLEPLPDLIQSIKKV